MPNNIPLARSTEVNNGSAVISNGGRHMDNAPEDAAITLEIQRQIFREQFESGKVTEDTPDVKNLNEEFRRSLTGLRELLHLVEDEDKKGRHKSENWSSSPGEVAPGHMQIGLIRMKVPPEAIAIHEMPNNIEVPGLRTDGTTVIKSGRGRIQISMDLVFEGEDEINGPLRQLTGLFRSYPYVPIISDYLTRIVSPKLQRTLPAEAQKRLDKQLQEATEDLIQAKFEVQAALDEVLESFFELKELVTARGPYFRAVEAFFSETESLQALEQSLYTIINELRDAILELPRSSNVIDARQAVDRVGDRMQAGLEKAQLAIMTLQQVRHTRAQAEIGGLVDTSKGVVPVCLDQLQVYTVEGFPHMLRARLSVVFFNAQPYGGILEWADIRGRPTTDPSRATFMRNYLETRWLKDPSIPELPGQPFSLWDDPQDFFKFDRTVPIVGLGRMVDGDALINDLRLAYATTEFEQLDPATARSKLGAGLTSDIQSLLEQSQPRYRTIRLGQGNKGDKETSHVTIDSITVSMSNRLALQPVQGEFYPSVQYVGAKPAYITVSMVVTDEDELKKIHQMKAANQRMTTLGIRNWRRPEVHIRNSIVNLMGVYTAQIDDITTTTIGPDADQVVIRFVEHRIDLQEREAISRSTLFGKIPLIRAFEYIFKRAQEVIEIIEERVNTRQARKERETGKREVAVLKPSDLTAGLNGATANGRAAFDLLFGSLERLDIDEDATVQKTGILHPDVLARAFALNPVISQDVVVREQIYKRHLQGIVEARQFKEWIPKYPELIDNIIYFYNTTIAATTTNENLTYIRRKREKVNVERLTFASARQIRENYRAGYLPDSFELGLLADHLTQTVANATDEINVDDQGNVSVKSKRGVDKSASIQAMLRLARAILKNEVQGLRELVIGGEDTSITDYLRNRQQIPSNLYPDLSLPTYGEMLRPVVRAIERAREGDEQRHPSRDPVKLESVHQLQEGPERELMRRYIPTFEDIGKVPTGRIRATGQASRAAQLFDFAYDLTDDVLPDFPYFKTDTSQLYRDSMETAREGSQSGWSNLKRDRDASGAMKNPISSPLAQVLSQEEIFSKETGGEERQDPSRRAAPKSVGEANTELQETTQYRPDRQKYSKGADHNIGDPENAQKIFDATAQLSEKNQLRLQRCFPTFKLYFIEEDQEAGLWTAVDDVYGYNSVISINVTRHKYQADLAEVTLTNIAGNLELDKFGGVFNTTKDPITHPSKKRFSTDPQVQANQRRALRKEVDLKDPVEPGTNEFPQRRFPLSEGTRIAIKMGYHPREEFLETVFTGKISQVKMGDIVHFVAQGYLQELLFPMTENPSTETTRGVIEAAMNSPTVEHFGRWTPFSWQDLTDEELRNAQTRLSSGLGALAPQLRTFAAHPKFRNVFARQYQNWWGDFFSRMFLEESWEVGGGTKSAWDVIQEVTNFTPGMIAAVVPYDFEATLFVGRPEQPYFWTDGLRDQEGEFRQSRTQRQLQSLVNASELYRQFLLSPEYIGDYENTGLVAVAARKALTSGVGLRLFNNVNAGSDFMRPIHPLRIIQTEMLTHPNWTLWFENIAGSEAKPTDFVERGSSQVAQNPHLSAQFAEELGFRVSMALTDVANGGLHEWELREILEVREGIAINANPARDYTTCIQLIGGDPKAAKDVVLDLLIRLILKDIHFPELEPNPLTLINDDDPGYFAHLTRWHNFLVRNLQYQKSEEQARADIESSTEQVRLGLAQLKLMENPVHFFREVWAGKEVTWKVCDTAANVVEMRSGTEEQHTALALACYRYRASIPVILNSLRTYLEGDSLLAFAVGQTQSRELYPFNPRMKPFRQGHLVTTFDDLMDNGMAASRATMWNGVAIGSGSDSPQVIWADDGIRKGDRILRYFHEPNADLDLWNVTNESVDGGFINNRFLVGFSRLAQGLRFMYRGHLTLRGRPDIKPWDVIYLYDTYNFIFGPIEVERVTHHFSQETGFVTTIVPHAMVVPNNQVDSFNIMSEGWKWGSYASGLVLAGGLGLGLVAGLVASVPVAAAIAVGGAGAVKTLADAVLQEATGTGIIGNLNGVGHYGSMPSPVKIFPLMRQGVEWSAALDGFGKGPKKTTGWIFEQLVKSPIGRLQKRVHYADKAARFFWENLVNARGSLDELTDKWIQARGTGN